MKRTNEKETPGYPGSMIRKKKSRSLSPLLLMFCVFILLLMVFIFFPIHDALMHRDLILPQSEAQSMQTEFSATIPTPVCYTPLPAPTQAPLPLTVLVNGKNPMPEDYDLSGLMDLNAVQTDLFSVKEENTMVHSVCLQPLMEMLTAAHADGLTDWQISEGYRSIEAQQKMWNEQYEKYRYENGLSEEKALQAVSRRVAKPGCSEHHTGLALDITVPGESFRLTPQAKWLNDHCHEYGFIIRYTEEKEYLTGITAEPWHIRYVGKEAAKIMKENNWCLEEYTQKARK